MTTNKHQLSIYRLQGSVASITEELEKEKYSEQGVAAASSETQVRLFYRRTTATPRWKSFISDIASAGTPILKAKRTAHESFALVIRTSGSNVYAVTGGHGHMALVDFVDPEFGIDILIRLTNKTDRSIRATREKSVVGGILGVTKHFRNTYNFFDNETFGTIYKELQSTLDKPVLIERFGFETSELKRNPLVVAKSSFRIRKAISFSKLLKLVSAFDGILAEPAKVEINRIQKIPKKSDPELVVGLRAELDAQLWNTFLFPETGYAFDLCHADYDLYLTADLYRITRLGNEIGEVEGLRDVPPVFELLKTEGSKAENASEFGRVLDRYRIVSLDADGQPVTDGSFYAHLVGDVSHKGTRYFFIENQWYEVDAGFLTDLDEACSQFVVRNSAAILTKAWDPADDEADYNTQYLGEPSTLVLDRVTVENIELCDVLKWDDDVVYLCHVKKGFGNTMRDLCSQILIAANRVTRDMAGSRTFLTSIYRSLKAKKGLTGHFDSIGNQTKKLTENEFVQLFDKEVKFVLAVVDTSTSEKRELKDMKKFGSTIAKFSLHALLKDMRALDLSLLVNQIPSP